MEPEIDPRAVTEQVRTQVNELLDIRGVSRHWLAREMGVQQPYVSQMLSGYKPLTLTFVAHALAVLGADLEVRRDSQTDWEFSRTPDLGRSA